MNKLKRYQQITNLQIIFLILEVVRLANNLQEIVSHFFMELEPTSAFFHSSGKVPLSKNDLKVISRGLLIDGPQYS